HAALQEMRARGALRRRRRLTSARAACRGAQSPPPAPSVDLHKTCLDRLASGLAAAFVGERLRGGSRITPVAAGAAGVLDRGSQFLARGTVQWLVLPAP